MSNIINSELETFRKFNMAEISYFESCSNVEILNRYNVKIDGVLCKKLSNSKYRIGTKTYKRFMDLKRWCVVA